RQLNFNVSKLKQIGRIPFTFGFALNTKSNLEGSSFLNYLENLAKSIFYQRFMSDFPKDYYDIIYKIEDKKDENNTIDKNKLNRGTAVENFIFNYLDYILWVFKEKNIDELNKNLSNFNNFEFTYRSSVEHYYPQHPINASDNLEDKDENDIKYIDYFGNLCLISPSNNSKLSNYMPIAKKEHYTKNTKQESLKQQLMMSEEKWEKDEIETHTKWMIQLLSKFNNNSHGN
ncbi:HNH endonuclease family protein, partial [Ornithobacterium rhinotracheale]|uniref:HNH endonuclease family protein n=1 Tax=Ornithobacterium rhinotracheale TaxID=28251 RepID=UPI004035B307